MPMWVRCGRYAQRIYGQADKSESRLGATDGSDQRVQVYPTSHRGEEDSQRQEPRRSCKRKGRRYWHTGRRRLQAAVCSTRAWLLWYWYSAERICSIHSPGRSDDRRRIPTPDNLVLLNETGQWRKGSFRRPRQRR